MVMMAPPVVARHLPKLIADVIDDMVNSRKSGSVTIHFEQGNMRICERHEKVRLPSVDESK